MIIDGDERLPTEIAADMGFTGEVVIPQDLKDAAADVVKNNPEIVEQIWQTHKSSPIMALVNKVTESLNRKCDPVMIRHLLNEEI